MSSDNYYAIRIHPRGGFTAIDASASDDRWPVVRDLHPRFDTLSEAIAYGNSEYSEYGVKVHPECNPEIQSEATKRRRQMWELEDQLTTHRNLLWDMWSDIEDRTGFRFSFDFENFAPETAALLTETLGDQVWVDNPLNLPDPEPEVETRAANDVEIDGQTYSVFLPSWGIVSDDWQRLDRNEKEPLWFTPAVIISETDPL